MRDAYYADGSVQIYNGDALEVMRSMPAESVDIVVTSPPYNMGLTPGGNGRGMYGHKTQRASRFTNTGYDGGSDAMPADEYEAFLRDGLVEMWRIARLAVWWNHRPRIIHGELRDPLDGAFPIGRPLQRIILSRPTGIDVNLRHFTTRQEHLYLFAKPDFRLVDHATSGMGDVWPTPLPPKGEHPAPFDISVPRRCIAATKDVGSVLDPFLGSGTTLRAAKDLGVRGIGIDRSRRFCEMSVERCGGPGRHLEGMLDFGEAS